LLNEHGWGFSAEFAPASNYWAVQNLTDADAAFVNGPQFGWSTPSYVYGVGLHGGDFNVVGNTLLGLPSLLFAHNNKVAWGSTAGLSDQVDVFVEKLNPDNPDQYWHNGEYKNFEQWQENIQSKSGKTETVTARRSVHGMVQQWLPDKGVAYTRARSWEGREVASLMAWVNLAKDQTLDAMKTRIGEVGTNINFYTMDADGNLGYTHAGRYPLRAAGHDPRLPASGDGAMDWTGFLPYSENPTVRNPEQGYIVNWNNRPAANWPSSDLWPLTWARSDRVDHLSNAIEQTDKAARNVEWLWNINDQVSYDDVSAPYLLPHLARALQTASLDAATRHAWQLLNNWDQEWRDTDGFFGPAAALMEAWHRQLLQTAFADDIGEAFMPFYSATHTPNKSLGASMGTPPGTRALLRNLDKLQAGAKPDYDFFNGKADEVLRNSFTAAIDELNKRYGKPDNWKLASWGLRWQPLNFRGVPQALPDNTEQLSAYMNRGSENNLFIAREGRIESFDVIPPGQKASGKHSNDQMQMFAEFRYKPVPIDIKDVKAQAVSTESVTID
jgi:penicillin amidase